MTISPRRIALIAVIAVVLIAAGVVAIPRVIRRFTAPAAAAVDSAPVPRLALNRDTIQLPAELAANLGIQTCSVESASAPVTLEMAGTLMFDADRLSHVHARFPGEIVELGPGEGSEPTVSFGQRVRKGQLLAVIWSRDLGEKKSDLIDALSQLRVDEESLARISKAAGEGAVPDRVLQDARRKVEADRIAVSRAVRTLQSWRIPKEEIDEVRAEAAKVGRDKTPGREEMVAQWAKLEVRSPLDGTVIERNVALGDLVDTNLDLFKIADLSRLRVLAHAYEEDLPSLDAVQGKQRPWTVNVGSGSETTSRPGQFDKVGCIIDPNQHTAMVMGWVDNADRSLRVGQYATVRLEVPPPRSEVVVPAAALCEEGGMTSVFVNPPGTHDYVRRQIAVSRRSGDKVYLRGRLTADERRRGVQSLSPGESVVISRTAQLTAGMNELQAAAEKTGT